MTTPTSYLTQIYLEFKMGSLQHMQAKTLHAGNVSKHVLLGYFTHRSDFPLPVVPSAVTTDVLLHGAHLGEKPLEGIGAP